MNVDNVFVETVTSRIGTRVLTSTIRPATEDDIKQARELHAQGKCPHNVVTDKPAWLFDYRSCYVCGKCLGTV